MGTACIPISGSQKNGFQVFPGLLLPLSGRQPGVQVIGRVGRDLLLGSSVSERLQDDMHMALHGEAAAARTITTVIN